MSDIDGKNSKGWGILLIVLIVIAVIVGIALLARLITINRNTHKKHVTIKECQKHRGPGTRASGSDPCHAACTSLMNKPGFDDQICAMPECEDYPDIIQRCNSCSVQSSEDCTTADDWSGAIRATCDPSGVWDGDSRDTIGCPEACVEFQLAIEDEGDYDGSVCDSIYCGSYFGKALEGTIDPNFAQYEGMCCQFPDLHFCSCDDALMEFEGSACNSKIDLITGDIIPDYECETACDAMSGDCGDTHGGEGNDEYSENCAGMEGPCVCGQNYCFQHLGGKLPNGSDNELCYVCDDIEKRKMCTAEDLEHLIRTTCDDD